MRRQLRRTCAVALLAYSCPGQAMLWLPKPCARARLLMTFDSTAAIAVRSAAHVVRRCDVRADAVLVLFT